MQFPKDVWVEGRSGSDDIWLFSFNCCCVGCCHNFSQSEPEVLPFFLQPYRCSLKQHTHLFSGVYYTIHSTIIGTRGKMRKWVHYSEKMNFLMKKIIILTAFNTFYNLSLPIRQHLECWLPKSYIFVSSDHRTQSRVPVKVPVAFSKLQVLIFVVKWQEMLFFWHAF